MSKNVAVFVDVANIFYAAKAAGVDIDYVTLLKSASAGRALVRAYAYTGLDPDNENQRNFHSFLARNGYRVGDSIGRAFTYVDAAAFAALDPASTLEILECRAHSVRVYIVTASKLASAWQFLTGLQIIADYAEKNLCGELLAQRDFTAFGKPDSHWRLALFGSY